MSNIDFLFCLSLASSGSTAFIKFLSHDLNIKLLESRGEAMIRMSEKERIVFLKRNIKSEYIVADKSLPIVAWKNFPDFYHRLKENNIKTVYIGLIRNPYATISSMLHRGIKRKVKQSRKELLDRAMSIWVRRAQILANVLYRFDIPWIKYATLTTMPAVALQMLGKKTGRKLKIDPNAKMKVKDYPEGQPLMNYNDTQIGWLSKDEIKEITDYLYRFGLEVMSFFDFELQDA